MSKFANGCLANIGVEIIQFIHYIYFVKILNSGLCGLCQLDRANARQAQIRSTYLMSPRCLRMVKKGCDNVVNKIFTSVFKLANRWLVRPNLTLGDLELTAVIHPSKLDKSFRPKSHFSSGPRLVEQQSFYFGEIMQQTHISPKCIGGTRFGKIHPVLAICHPVNCCNAVHFGSAYLML